MGKGGRPPRGRGGQGTARRPPGRAAEAARPAPAPRRSRRWPRRWAAVVRWFILRPLRLWWTQGWPGRLLARWRFGQPGATPEGGARNLQQQR